jgi:glycosyltransferase involved in cell wall biosynthesis
VRILHLIAGLGVGGAERQLSLLVDGLKGCDMEQSVVAMTSGGAARAALEAAGAQVTELGLRRGTVSPGAVRALRRVIAASRPDVLHAWMYHANLASRVTLGGIRPRPVLIWGIRSSLEAPGSYSRLTRCVIKANRFLSSGVDRIIFNSSASARQHARAGFATRGSVVIPNGVDTLRFRPSETTREALRHEWRVPADAQVVGHAARFDPSKNHRGLLTAFASVLHGHPGTKFVMCGTGITEGNASFAGWLREMGLLGKVLLLPERTDLENVLPGFDFSVSASLREGFPNVVAESMACAVPVIGTDVGDTKEIVGDSGFVAPAGNAADLASSMERALALTQEQRRSMGIAARARIEARYSVSNMVNAYLAVYEETFAGPAGERRRSVGAESAQRRMQRG